LSTTVQILKAADRISFNIYRFLFSALIALGIATGQVAARAQVAPLSAPQIIDAYEGQNVSAVEIAGRPGLDLSRVEPFIIQKAGQPFSRQKIDATMAALKAAGQPGKPQALAPPVQDVELSVQPDANGVRVRFVLHPASYFGVFDFPGALHVFSYSRLLQLSGYEPQRPYSAVDLERAQTDLTNFFHRTGFFLAEVRTEIQPETAHGIVNVLFRTTLDARAKIGTVAIEGVSPEETARLQKSLHTLLAHLRGAYLKDGTTYTMKKLRTATTYLQRELGKQRRLTAKVQLVSANYHADSNRADVTFRVTPGPKVRIDTQGAHLWSRTRRKLIPMYQEGRVDNELIEEGRRNLDSYFQSKGYFDAKVQADVNRQPAAISIVYRIQTGARHKVADVTVKGNEHFSDREVLSRTQIKKAGFVGHGKYNQELLRKSIASISNLYKNAGYGQVRVTPHVTRENGNVVVALFVQEGPLDIVDSLQVQGVQTVTIAQLAPKGLKLAPGKPYSEALLQQDRNQIMARYLALGYLTANFRAVAKPVQGDRHRIAVVYEIYEGPRVDTGRVIILGRAHARQSIISKAANIKSGQPLSEGDLLTSEARLYTLGPFDWAEVSPRRRITTQSQEDVVIKVHESKRNSVTFGFGFEVINRGGSLPSGTVVVPGIPPVGLPSNFQTNEQTFYGPRGSIQYTRRDLRGAAESFTMSALAGRLDQRGALTYSIPHFRGSGWTASATGSGENNDENPIFSAQTGYGTLQFQKPLDAKRTKNVILRYSFQYTSISRLLIPDLVPPQDQQYHLSGFGAAYTRDTRDKVLDAHRGLYQSFDLSLNATALGSSVDFARFLGQVAYYKNIGHNIIWANSIRLGLEQAFNNSFVPLSEQFFTGGGSTLRGFSLNGAGPQRVVCLNNDCSSQTLVPVGGEQLFLVNSEFRIPIPIDFPAPIHKNLGFAVFYDGGNAFQPVGFHNISFTDCGSNVITGSTVPSNCFTSSVGAGLRYYTPLGPIRLDIGHNLNGIPGIKSTQLFITLGQAF
jgi:outer membrane protein insertion porin family